MIDWQTEITYYIMKLVLKILKISAFLIIAISIILFTASLILQDKVAYIILESLNNKISTKLDVHSVKLSFLKKFPKASLELKNVVVHSSPDFNSAAFAGHNTDTLLSAKSVSVDFKITDIIRGNYNIERISAKSGIVNLYTDTSGHVNYDITVKSKSSGNKDITINLERVNLDGINGYYNNLANKLIVTGLIKDGRLRGSISGKNLDFAAGADMEITGFQLFNTRITKTIAAEIDLTLQRSEYGIRFKKSSLTIDNFDLGLDGTISSDNILDLKITGHNIDLAKIRKYLPEQYLKLVADYNPSGKLIIDCSIQGLLTRTSNPHVEIYYSLNKGQISYGRSDLSVDNLSFSGNFSNGSKNNRSTSSVFVKDFKARLGSSEYAGSFSVSRFDRPSTQISLKGRVFPEELKEFFDLQNISTADGSVDLDLDFVTGFWPKGKITVNDVIDLKPEGNLVFNSFSIGFQNNDMLFSQVNGNLFVSDHIKAENFRFRYKGQEIKVDGDFRNLPGWLSGRPVQMKASANVVFDRLIPEAFFSDYSSSANKLSYQKAFSLPYNMILDINFKIDSLTYKTFSSSEITGSLNYKPRILTFESLNMKSLNGSISGDGFVVQNSTKSVIAKGSFNVSDIDVNKAFKTFHNFGQNFLKAENISGTLSGSLSLLLPMDSMLIPQIKSVTAEGKYLLVNGNLINFDPVKQLSAYIELSELENIHFTKFENDFFIRNNFLYIPQMDVRSSAVDLSVNGKHSFENNYEYHVKMLLSEILSKKRKKTKNNVTEFGVVEDDGLGRTSLMLKIVGKGEDVKVGYDLKAVSNEVKENIKTERQTLKSILNQEYGWFKNDTSARQKPAEKKSRFKISWDETDSTSAAANPPVVRKDTGIKSLFRKK